MLAAVDWALLASLRVPFRFAVSFQVGALRTTELPLHRDLLNFKTVVRSSSNVDIAV